MAIENSHVVPPDPGHEPRSFQSALSLRARCIVTVLSVVALCLGGVAFLADWGWPSALLSVGGFVGLAASSPRSIPVIWFWPKR